MGQVLCTTLSCMQLLGGVGNSLVTPNKVLINDTVCQGAPGAYVCTKVSTNPDFPAGRY